jgi:hypothetical protein
VHVLAKRSLTGLAAAALAFAFTTAFAADALAKGKNVQTEAQWVRYDPETKTVTVKVKKPGRGKDAKLLKKNRHAVFVVTSEGPARKRTTVAINGVKGELTDIPKGETVNVYWRPDAQNPQILRARKIDVIMSDEDLDAKSGKAKSGKE